jgi:flagellar hook protein FlgE
MDVIGNNIANVNTEAFKASSVRFSELMYQTISSASSGNGATGTGGVNAKQIGLGVNTASTTVNITGAGSSETTGNPFDLKLSDSQTTNFFIVSDGTNTMFTRAGSFYVDGNGYLCMSSTGYTVQGWQVDASTGEIRKDTVTPLQVMSPANSNASPEATTKAYVNGVLDKEDTNLNSDDGYVMTLGIYDSLGYNYTAKFAVKPTDSTAADGTQYHISLTDIVDSTGTSIITGTDEQKAATLQRIWGGTTDGYDMTFDTNNGSFVSIGTGTDGEVPTSQLLNLAEGLGTGYTTNNGDGTTTTSNFANVEVDFSSALSPT